MSDVEQRLEDALNRIAALELGQGRSGPLSGYEAWRAFFTGKTKYDGRGAQLLTQSEEADGATLLWLTSFLPEPFQNPQAVPAGIIQGFYVNGQMDMSMTATRDMKNHYDGAPQGAYGLLQAVSRSATNAGSWVQAQTDGSGIAAVVRAKAGTDIAACQILGTFHLSTVLIPATLAANADDYEPDGIHYSSVVELAASTPVNITGIVPVADDGQGFDVHVGRILILSNTGANAITLKDDSASSAEANRFSLQGDLILASKAGATLFYSADSSRWRCVGNY